jgi:hypothetical protein
MSLEQLQDQIAVRVDGGDDLAAIEMELIKPVPWLSEDERAALWLFAWSYQRAGGERLANSSSAIASITAPRAARDVAKPANRRRRPAHERQTTLAVASPCPPEVDPEVQNT